MLQPKLGLLWVAYGLWDTTIKDTESACANTEEFCYGLVNCQSRRLLWLSISRTLNHHPVCKMPVPVATTAIPTLQVNASVTSAVASSSATTTLPVAAESVVTFVTVFAFGCLVIFSVYLYKKFADSGGATLLVRTFWHKLYQQLVFSYLTR